MTQAGAIHKKKPAQVASWRGRIEIVDDAVTVPRVRSEVHNGAAVINNNNDDGNVPGLSRRQAQH